MPNEINKFNQFEIDVLKEIGNIGAGNAATAMAKLLGKKIRMTVPQVMVLKFSETPEAVGGAEKLMAGIYLEVENGIKGSILFLMPKTDAYGLIEFFTGNPISSGKKLDEIQESVLLELGNILAGAYLTALSDFIKINLHPSVPALAIDMAGALLSAPLSRYAHKGDSALLINTELEEGRSKIRGYFLLIPDTDSFSTIFTALGVKRDGYS